MVEAILFWGMELWWLNTYKWNNWWRRNTYTWQNYCGNNYTWNNVFVNLGLV